MSQIKDAVILIRKIELMKIYFEFRDFMLNILPSHTGVIKPVIRKDYSQASCRHLYNNYTTKMLKFIHF